MKLTYPDHSVLTVRSTVSTSVLISSLKAMAVPISLRLWYTVLKVTSVFLQGSLPNVLATGLSVRWKGYSPDSDTWEPVENLSLVPQLISTFESSDAAGRRTRRNQKYPARSTPNRRR